MATLPQVITIVGPTASGKTQAGITLAKQKNGAILSADSRQLYAGLDIGTAKPQPAHGQPVHPITKAEIIDDVPHYFFNIRQPNQPYDLANWQQDAFTIIDQLLAQNVTPILVGGTMLYIDCIAFNYAIPTVPPNPELRQELEQQPVTTLYTQLLDQDPRSAQFIQAGNKRRIIRALEVMAATGQPFSAQRLQHEPKYDIQWHGLSPDWSQLESNITQRIQEMIATGLLEETKKLQKQYGADLPLLQTMNYQQAGMVLDGTLPEIALAEAMIRANVRYARRQMSWWRSNAAITWYASGQKLLDNQPNTAQATKTSGAAEAARTHNSLTPRIFPTTDTSGSE